MSLIFKDSEGAKLIAHVYAGKHNNERIYISFDDNVPTHPIKDPFIILNDEWFRNRRKNMKSTELIRLQHAILKRKVPEDDELEEIYEEAINFLNSRQKKEIILEDGRIVPTMPKDPTVRTYTCGPTGSGKTTWVINYCKEILLRAGNRKKKIFIFSVLTEDEALDKLGVLRIKIDDSLLSKPIQLDELKNSICIFDDIETFSNKKYRDTVANLRDQCLSEGRHHGISTMCTNHQITDYKKTRNMLAECEFITFFPQSGGLNNIKRLLTTYIGLGKEEMNKILCLPSRWVTIYNRYPLTCLYESGIFLLGNNNIKLTNSKPMETVNIKGDTSIDKDDESDEEDYKYVKPHKTIII
jgi:hypothetical protein